MAEEVIPFVIIFIPLARRLGYDSIVGVSIPFLGAAAGFAAAFFNPFTVGIAQSIAGLPLYSGLGYRLVTWVVGTAVMIAWVVRYARRVKRDPEISPVRDIDLGREEADRGWTGPVAWDARHAATLSLFVLAMGLLVFGVLWWKWYIEQIAVLFLGMGIVLGFAGGLGPSNPTPEGARDFLVPSRVYKGRFYALPQSPQQFKQTLMVSGFDRYFQIVRSFRDEALRADRQLEFTQIDIETSFIDLDDFFGLNEGLMEALFALTGRKVKRPFPRLPYAEAMEKYGSDKPDLRVPLEMKDLTAAAATTGSEMLKAAVAGGSEVKGLLVPGAGTFSRGQLDKLSDKAKSLGAKGLVWIKKQDGWKSSLKMADSDFEQIWAALAGADADLALLIADKKETALKALGEIRRTGPIEDPGRKDRLAFCWVTGFPLFEWSEEESRFV